MISLIKIWILFRIHILIENQAIFFVLIDPYPFFKVMSGTKYEFGNLVNFNLEWVWCQETNINPLVHLEGGAVRPHLCFLPFTPEKCQRTHTWNFSTFSNFWMQIPRNFFSKKFCLHPLTTLLGQLVQKNSFLFYQKKDFKLTLPEIIFVFN